MLISILNLTYLKLLLFQGIILNRLQLAIMLHKQYVSTFICLNIGYLHMFIWLWRRLCGLSKDMSALFRSWWIIFKFINFKITYASVHIYFFLSLSCFEFRKGVLLTSSCSITFWFIRWVTRWIINQTSHQVIRFIDLWHFIFIYNSYLFYQLLPNRNFI